MIIDFTKISSIIPSEGTLNLLFTKKDENITICYAPKFKGKEDNENFSPVTVSGTAEELNDLFDKDMPDIASLNETLFESTKIKAKAATVASAKKTSITKAIAKGTSTSTPAKPADEKKENRAEQKAAAPMFDLFAPTQPAKTVEASSDKSAISEETEKEETEETEVVEEDNSCGGEE